MILLLHYKLGDLKLQNFIFLWQKSSRKTRVLLSKHQGLFRAVFLSENSRGHLSLHPSQFLESPPPPPLSLACVPSSASLKPVALHFFDPSCFVIYHISISDHSLETFCFKSLCNYIGYCNHRIAMDNPDYSLYLIVLNLIACTKYLLPCYVIDSLILELGHEHLERGIILPSEMNQ